MNLTPEFGKLPLLIVAPMVFKSAGSFGPRPYAGVPATRVSNALRLKLIAAVLDARGPFYADWSGGQFAKRSATAAQALEVHMVWGISRS